MMKLKLFFIQLELLHSFKFKKIYCLKSKFEVMAAKMFALLPISENCFFISINNFNNLLKTFKKSKRKVEVELNYVVGWKNK
jgi:hypothetical protein